MMHRDSPGMEPETTDAEIPRPDRRFARLVESSAARRLAMPRLALATGIGLSVVGLVVYLGTWVVRATTGYVASLPDQQLRFSDIKLVPEPGLWVKGGKARLLEQVRLASKRGETLSLLDFEPKRLANDLVLGSSWVKQVNKIERSPKGLTVSLEYRKPVAVVVLGTPGRDATLYTIDEQAVPHASDDIEWTSTTEPFQVQGISEPLVQIKRVDSRSRPTFGLPWKAVNEDGQPGEPDLMVLRAAGLLDFFKLNPRRRHRESLHPGLTRSGYPMSRLTRSF